MATEGVTNPVPLALGAPDFEECSCKVNRNDSDDRINSVKKPTPVSGIDLRLGTRLSSVSFPFLRICPPGDDRDKVYRATNLGAGESWEASDSQHSCRGA